MVITSLLPVTANLGIVYLCLAIGIALLLSELRAKSRYGWTGMVLLTVLAGIMNYRYGVNDVGETIAFFISLYDPFYNIGATGDLSRYPGLVQCQTANCTMLPSMFQHHPPWAATFHYRFTAAAEASIRCGKLYAHIWLNTTGFIMCLFQVHEGLRNRYLWLHRKLGWAAIAMVSGGTLNALWLSSEHSAEDDYGNHWAVAGWILMASTVFGTLIPGVLAVLRKDIPAHKKWMIRFYGSLWGSFLVFRIIFLFGALFRWHKTILTQIAIWTSAPAGVAIAEWVRLHRCSVAEGDKPQ